MSKTSPLVIVLRAGKNTKETALQAPISGIVNSESRWLLALISGLAALSGCQSSPANPPRPETSQPAAPEPSATEVGSRADIVDPVFVEADTVSLRGPTFITRQVLQDATGDLWLASFNGVYRYDGQVFTNITNEAGLQRTRAFSLLQDHAQNIWLGTLGAGAYRFDGKTYTNITSRDGLAGDQVLSMMEDRDHGIWFGFAESGVTRYDGTTFTSFDQSDGFTNGDVSSMAQDQAGRIWLGTRAGLFSYDGESFVNHSDGWGLTKGAYIPVLVADSGHLWFGGTDGLHRYDGQALRQITTDESSALLEQDAAGNIWFSSPGALNKIDPRSLHTHAKPDVILVAWVEGLIFDVFEDRDGDVWVGLLKGMGRVDGNTVHYPM